MISSHSKMKNTTFSRTELYFFYITEGCVFLKYQLTWFVLSEVEEKLSNWFFCLFYKHTLNGSSI